MNVNPILINSSLVSAQNRKRLYWTNIENISQPENKNLFFGDIVDNRIEKYRLWTEDQMHKWHKKNMFAKIITK